MGVGLALPALNTLVTGSVAFAGRGLLTALYGSVRFLGVAVGPPLFGMVETWGALPVYLGGAAAGGAVLVVVLGLLDQTVLEGPTQPSGGPAYAAPTGDERLCGKDEQNTRRGGGDPFWC